jgi:hypothetical protein
MKCLKVIDGGLDKMGLKKTKDENEKLRSFDQVLVSVICINER